jgi:hypothetical protein
MNIEISEHIFVKILKFKISRKSLQWKLVYSMMAGGRTGMTKLMDAFSQFYEKATKN